MKDAGKGSRPNRSRSCSTGSIASIPPGRGRDGGAGWAVDRQGGRRRPRRYDPDRERAGSRNDCGADASPRRRGEGAAPRLLKVSGWCRRASRSPLRSGEPRPSPGSGSARSNPSCHGHWGQGSHPLPPERFHAEPWDTTDVRVVVPALRTPSIHAAGFAIPACW